MNTLPPSLRQVSLFLERLPGIGEKTAHRLAFYLLRLPDQDLKEFAHSVNELKEKTKLCKNCLNLTEDELCVICQDTKRDHDLITVVENVLDLLSFETGNMYDGVYHVLHGRIDPLNHISPEDIYINKLLERIEKKKESLEEIILATNPDMEGEATAMYVKNKVHELQKSLGTDFKVTRLAYGLPMGANLEYADYMTLRKAMEGRNKY